MLRVRPRHGGFFLFDRACAFGSLVQVGWPGVLGRCSAIPLRMRRLACVGGTCFRGLISPPSPGPPSTIAWDAADHVLSEACVSRQQFASDRQRAHLLHATDNTWLLCFPRSADAVASRSPPARGGLSVTKKTKTTIPIRGAGLLHRSCSHKACMARICVVALRYCRSYVCDAGLDGDQHTELW